jgi:hypothetical protein
VIDRPETTPVENWQRRARGRRGNQQLVPIGDITDVGKTVNRTVGTVHDVGSKLSVQLVIQPAEPWGKWLEYPRVSRKARRSS